MWIGAASFYAKNFNSIKQVVNSFDPDEAKSIKEAQQLLEKDSLAADLTLIHSNLGFLAGAITQLEEAGLPLSRSLGIIYDAQKKLSSLSSETGIVFKDKLNQVMRKNATMEILEQVDMVLRGEAHILP